MASGAESETPAARGEPSSAGVSDIPLAGLARFRERSYRLLSQSFLYPDDAVVQTACELASELADEGDIRAEMAYSRQLDHLRSLWCEIDEAGQVRMQTRYVSLFAVATDQVPCPPYESSYTTSGASSEGFVLASIERDYAAAGLSGTGEKKQSPDHISMETEFLAILCGQEAQAWETDHGRQGRRHLEKERKFIETHLGEWLPPFALAVQRVDERGIYAEIAAATLSFVTHDRDLTEELANLLAVESEQHEPA